MRTFHLKKSLILLPIALFLGLLAIFSFYDLPISQSLVGSFPRLSRFFEIGGFFPSCIVACIGSAICFATNYTAKTKGRKIAGAILCPIVFYAACTYALLQLFHAFNLSLDVWQILLLSFALSVILLVAVSKINPNQLVQFRRGALAALMALILILLIVEILKNTFGRIRFRDMTDLAEFTPWYILNGPTGHKSFPSGHTANAAILLTGAFFCRSKKTRFFWIGFGLFFVLCMAITRIMIGAHFASDVLIGGLIGIFSVYFSGKRYHLL